MPKFDRRLHKPAPENIRRIIASKGLTNAQAAKRLGVSVRTVNAWTSLTDANHREPHYVYQFALESLEGIPNQPDVRQNVPGKR